MTELDATDRQLVTALQGGIDVVERPFADLATSLGISEEEVVERLESLLDDGVLTRFGPMYNADRMGGAFTLCAMCVPETRFDEVTQLVNAHTEVAHNYRREHRLNMWFVIATQSPERIAQVIESISKQTRLQVLDLPKLEEFYVGLHLAV